MALWLWLPIALIALLAVALGLRTAGRRAVLGVDPTRLSFPPELMAEVSELARSRRTVAAVTLLRERTPGLSVAHAKRIVDRLAVREQPALPSAPADPGPDRDQAPSGSSVPLEVELQVRGQVSAGDPAGALRTLAAATGWDDDRAVRYLDTLS